MSGVPVGVSNRCLTAPLLGTTLWLSPEEESHTKESSFASLYLQNLNLRDGAGPRGGAEGYRLYKVMLECGCFEDPTPPCC